MIRQGIAFGLVGCAALATHLGMVALLVQGFGLPILLANALGFLTAFTVSFNGHSRWTFEIGGDFKSAARRRFFVVACGGFLLNQAIYAQALRISSGQYYMPILAAILLTIAVITFGLSKFWAFSSRSQISAGLIRPALYRVYRR